MNFNTSIRLNPRWLFLFVPVVVVSCQAESESDRKTKAEIREIVFVYHNYRDSNNISPRDADDLVRYFPNNEKLDALLKGGHYVVVWNAVMELKEVDSWASHVLIYEDQPDAKGDRWMAMQDGTVRSMTGSEFEKAPKAKTKAN
jgi:hypothetical protein